MTAYLLLAALAWTVATRGGTGVRDIAVVVGLLVIAMVAGRAWPRRDVALWAVFSALICWLMLAGPLRTGLTLETVRVPLLVMIVALTALVVRRMGARERDTLVTGIVVVGCFQAILALVQAAGTASIGMPLSPRADALLGSSNGLGILLVATLVLTARELDRRGGWLPVAALLAQGLALLSTGSRTAIVVASVLAIGYVAAHPSWKLGLLAAVGLAAGMAVVLRRVATEGQEDRPELWQEALERIARQPLVGEGPPVEPFTSGARLTTHAHNELLQWGVEYGLVGIGLGVAVLVLAARSVRLPTGGGPWLQVAALAVLTAGLTDFTLRIPTLALTAAALVALAVTADLQTTSPGADLTTRAVAG